MMYQFIKDESGAVTVDWTAVTAGILLLAIGLIYGIFNSGVATASKSINSTLVTTGDAINYNPAPKLN